MTNALLIPDWSVSDVHVDENDAYQISASYDLAPQGCQQCRSIGPLVKRGARARTYVDAPVHGRHTFIHVQHRKYTCRQCGASFMQHLPGMHHSRRMTKRLVNYIEKQSLLKPIAHVSEDTGISEGTVGEIAEAHFDRLSQDHARDLRAPRYIGIDELELGNKQMRAIFINLEDSWPFELLRNRSLNSVRNFLMKLPNRGDVEVVTMDMCKYCRKAVKKTMPQAAIIADRWHMADKVNDAMDEARRRYQRTIHLDHSKALKKVNRIFLKRRAELSGSEAIDLGGWLANSEELYATYEAKEALLDIWNLQDRATAETALDEWRALIPDDKKHVFSAVAGVIDNWRTEILNFFDHGRFTNGRTEARNGVIKRVYNYGAGYKFESIRARALFGKRPGRLKKEADAKDEAWRVKKPLCVSCGEPLDEAAQMERWKTFAAPHMMPPPRFHRNYVCHPCMDDPICDFTGLTSPASASIG